MNKEEKESPPKDKPEEEKGDEGVTVPEDFQRDAHNLMKKATTKHHVEHVRSRVNQKDDELRKVAMDKEKKGKPSEFSTDSAPASVSDSY